MATRARPASRSPRLSEENYLTTLADYMHGLGLAWIAKNLDDTDRTSFVDAMEPLAQGIISEQCNQYHTCSYLQPFLAAGKWVGNAEYSKALSQFCPSDNAADMNGILFNREPRRWPQPLPLNGSARTLGPCDAQGHGRGVRSEGAAPCRRGLVPSPSAPSFVGGPDCRSEGAIFGPGRDVGVPPKLPRLVRNVSCRPGI